MTNLNTKTDAELKIMAEKAENIMKTTGIAAIRYNATRELDTIMQEQCGRAMAKAWMARIGK